MRVLMKYLAYTFFGSEIKSTLLDAVLITTNQCPDHAQDIRIGANNE